MIKTEHLSDSVTLHLGDCREILPTLPRADVVMTDPPYGEVTHAGARSANSLDRTTIGFAAITSEDMAGLCRAFVEAANRWVVMTCEWRHAASLEAAGVPLVRLGVWIKPNMARRSLPGIAPEQDGKPSLFSIARAKSDGITAVTMPFGIAP